MKTSGWLCAGVIVLACGARGAFATTSVETQQKLKDELLHRQFTAKVEIYEASLDEAGNLKSEFDAESIRPGMPILIDRIQIGYSNIRIVMRHPKIKEKTWLRFDFAKELTPDFSREREAFEKMLGVVFDEKKDEEKKPEAATTPPSS